MTDKDTKAKLDEAKGRIYNLEDDWKNLHKQLTVKEKEIEDLKKKSADYVDQFRKKKTQLIEAYERAALLEQQLAQKAPSPEEQQQVKDLHDQSVSQSGEVVTKGMELAKAQEAVQATIIQLTDQLDALHRQSDNKDEELEAARGTTAELNDKIATLQIFLDDSISRSKQSELKYADKLDELAETLDELEKRDTTVEDLIKQLNDSKEGARAVQHELKETDQSLVEKTSELLSAQQRLSQLETRSIQQQILVSNLEQRFQAFVQVSKSELAAKQQQLYSHVKASLQVEEELREQLMAKEHELTRIRGMVGQLYSQFRGYVATINNLAKKLPTHEEEVKNLQSRIDHVSNSLTLDINHPAIHAPQARNARNAFLETLVYQKEEELEAARAASVLMSFTTQPAADPQTQDEQCEAFIGEDAVKELAQGFNAFIKSKYTL